MEEQGARKTNKLENLNKKLAEAVSKKDYALAATIQGELVKMEEHAAQKMNKLKVLNANLDEALDKKDYTLVLYALCSVLCALCIYFVLQPYWR